MYTIWLILTIYITVLFALIIISSSVAKHKRRFEIIFTYDVDYLFYEIAKSLVEAKEHLYDYENTLEVLYHDKKKIFTKPVLSYQEQYPKLKENMEYLEKLLQKSIFTDNFKKRLAQNYRTLKRVTRISNSIHTILTFLTLGIAKFWA